MRVSSLSTTRWRSSRAPGTSFAQRDDSRGLGRAELFLGNVHHLACRFEELQAAAERAERHFVAAGLSAGVCLSIQAEAFFYGPVPVADCIVRCAALLERSQDQSARAGVTAVLGALRALEGDCEAGRALLTDARSQYEEIGNERGLRTIWSPLLVTLEEVAGNHASCGSRGTAGVRGAAGER